MKVVGRFSAGRDNMAEEHDAYLDGAFE